MTKNDLLLQASVRTLQGWGAHNEDIRKILNISKDMLDNAGNTEDYEPDLTDDQKIRMAHICRIYVDLSRAFGELVARQWGGNVNMNEIFRGQSPLGIMEREGLDGIQKALAYVASVIAPN